MQATVIRLPTAARPKESAAKIALAALIFLVRTATVLLAGAEIARLVGL